MEEHTMPLEAVCRHFKHEYGSAYVQNLRTRLNRAYKKTAAARKEAQRERALAELLRATHQLMIARIREAVMRIETLVLPLTL